MKKLIAAALTLALGTSACTAVQTPAYAQVWRGTPFDRQTWDGASKYTIHASNFCGRTQYLAINYTLPHSGQWITKVWKMAPGETAYLADSRNGYIYVAQASDYNTARRNARNSNRTRFYMGSTYRKFTIRMCGR